MYRFLQVVLGTAAVLAVITAPVVFALHEQAQTRNFREVRPGVLYRSGQMTTAGLKRILNDYRIKTVISLRDGRSASERAEEEFCQREEVTFVRFLPSQWGDVGGSVPIESEVARFRAIMSDPANYPVLIHCFAGIHRTGAYCAVYRMEFEHWSNAEAIAEVKACGYVNLDEELDILGYLEQYRPTWMPKEEPAAAAPAETKPTVKKVHGKRPAVKGRRKPARLVLRPNASAKRR